MQTLLPCSRPETGLPLLDIDGKVATLTLRNPDVSNRMGPEDIEAVIAHIATANASGVLVLRLQGSGKYFCSGFDIGQMQPGKKKTGFEDMVNALESCKPVTIAVVNGGVYGGATDLVLACDFRIGVPHADMFMPAARLGLHFHRSGMQRYVSRLGLNHAKKLFLTAKRIDSQAMLDCGFLTDLADDAAIAAHVQELTRTLAGMAPLSLLAMKKHLNRIASGQLDVQELEQDIERAAQSSDIQEGRLAWKEKRQPVFQGQ